MLVGDPDWIADRILRLQAMGADEVIMRIDGFGHEKVLKTIELVGKYVIPRFKTPHNIAGPSPLDGPIP